MSSEKSCFKKKKIKLFFKELSDAVDSKAGLSNMIKEDIETDIFNLIHKKFQKEYHDHIMREVITCGLEEDVKCLKYVAF